MNQTLDDSPADVVAPEVGRLHASIVAAKENRMLRPSPWRKSVGGTPLERSSRSTATAAEMATTPMQKTLSKVLEAHVCTATDGASSDGSWSD